MKKKLFLMMVAVLAFMGCAKQDSVSVAHNELGKFYSFSTVDWARIDTMYYRPYNCDWPDGMTETFNDEFPYELLCKYWHLLQNAKTYLHQQTLPLRIGASDEFIQQLNYTESALDSVFVSMVSDMYYLRSFVDYYEEIMPQEITKCFETLNTPKQ